MVKRHNFMYACQLMARGDEWDAYEVEEIDGTPCVQLRRRAAGDKLKELIRTRFPKFNPYASSVATSKCKGSALVVGDDDLYVDLNISQEVVVCKTPFFNRVTKRAVPVVSVSSADPLVEWEFPEKVQLPSKQSVEHWRRNFPDARSPDADWFASPDLQAFRRVDVFSGREWLKRNSGRLVSLFGQQLPATAHTKTVSGPSRVHVAFDRK